MIGLRTPGVEFHVFRVWLPADWIELKVQKKVQSQKGPSPAFALNPKLLRIRLLEVWVCKRDLTPPQAHSVGVERFGFI